MNVLMSKVKDEEKCSVLSLLYSKLADSHGLKIPNDYLQLSLSAMKHLRESGRANILYKLAAIGEVRCDESDTKLNADGSTRAHSKLFKPGARLEITFMRTSVCVRVCVSVCPPPGLLKTIHVK